jgi:hypothetical protein
MKKLINTLDFSPENANYDELAANTSRLIHMVGVGNEVSISIHV